MSRERAEMNQHVAIGALVISWWLAGSLEASPLSGVKIAAVRDGEVCVSADGGALSCLGSTAPKARLPVWSRDGTKIAYIGYADSETALAWLMVVDQHGQVQSRIAIKPVVKGEVSSGMRAVESLEWIGSDRVVVSGSVNPSCSESLVVDLQQNSVVGGYIDNARGASFSPDGRHVVTIDGAPHFSAKTARAPVLRLDGREVLKGLHPDLGGASSVRWSADGSNFALIANDYSGHIRLLLGYAPSNFVRWVDFPVSASSEVKKTTLFWSGGDLHLQRVVAYKEPMMAGSKKQSVALGARNLTFEESVLVAGQHNSTWKRSSSFGISPVRAASGVRSAVLGKALPPDVHDVDVWCTGCALDKVSRSSRALDVD